MNKSKLVLITAYKKGYRVIEGEVYSPKKRKLKVHIDKRPYQHYYQFNINYLGKSYAVRVHRLVAYQKFGDIMLKSGIEVRHLNSNSLDNSYDNIAIGTHKQNMNDINCIIRKQAAIIASSANRKLSNKDLAKLKELREQGWTYPTLMEKFDISSKGTLHYMLNNNYQTTKK